MALSQTVQIIVQVVNNATQQMGAIVGGVNNLRASLTSLSEAAMDTARIGGIMTAAFALPVKVNTEFEKEMASVRAITQATDTEFKQLKDTAIAMGRETIYTSVQAAQGLTILAQAGFNTQESMKAIPEVIALAVQGAMSLDDAASIATQTVRGMGLSVDQLSKVNDVLAVGAAKTNVSVKELGESMKIAGPAGKGSKESLEDLVAVVGTLGDAGIKGSSAGNNVKRMLVALQNETPKTKNALAELGVKTKDAEGNFRGLIPVLTDLAEANMSMGDSAKIFGLYSASAALALTNQKDKLATLRDEMYETDGASKRMANTMRDTVDGAIKNLWASLQNLSITITDSLMVPIKTLINMFVGFTNAVSAFLGALGPLPGILFAVFGALSSLMLAFGGGAAILTWFMRGITGMTMTFAAFPKLWADMIIGLKTLGPMLSGLTTSFGSMAAIMATVRTAAAAMWASMIANPFAWVAGAVAGLVLLYNSMKTTTAELGKQSAAILDSKTKTAEYVDNMKKGTEADLDNVKAKKVGIDSAKRLVTHLGEMAESNKKVAVEAKAAANSIDKNTGAINDGGAALKAYNDKLNAVQYETSAQKMRILATAYGEATRNSGDFMASTTGAGAALGTVASGMTRTTIATTAYANGVGVVNNATLVMANTSLGLTAKLIGMGVGFGVATAAAQSFFEGFNEQSGTFGDKFSNGLRRIYTDTIGAWNNIKTATRAFMNSVSEWGFGNKFDFFRELTKIQESDKQKAKEDVAAAIKETIEYGLKAGAINPEWGADTFNAWLEQNKAQTAGGNAEIENMYRQHWDKVHAEFLRAELDISSNQRDTFTERKSDLKKRSEEELAIIIDLQRRKAEASNTVNTMKATGDAGLADAMKKEAQLFKEVKAAQEEHAKTTKSLSDVKMQLAKSTQSYAKELQADIDAEVASIAVKQQAYEAEKKVFEGLKQAREEAIKTRGAGSKEVSDIEVKMADSYQRQVTLLAELTVKHKELLPDLRSRKLLIQDEIKSNEELYKTINSIFGNAYPKAHAAAAASAKGMTDEMKKGEEELTQLTVDELIKRKKEDAVALKERAEEFARFVKSQADEYKKLYEDASASARAYHKEILELERASSKEKTDFAAKERELLREGMTQAEKVIDIEKEVGELKAKQLADNNKALEALKERTSAQEALNKLMLEQASEGARGGDKNQQAIERKAAEDRLKMANDTAQAMEKVWEDTTSKINSVEDSLTKQKKSREEERVKMVVDSAAKQAQAHGKMLSQKEQADIAYNAKLSGMSSSTTTSTADQKKYAERQKAAAAHYEKERQQERQAIERSTTDAATLQAKLKKFDEETLTRKTNMLKQVAMMQGTQATNEEQRAARAAEIAKTEASSKVTAKTAQEQWTDALNQQNAIMQKLNDTLSTQHKWLEDINKLMEKMGIRSKESKQEKIDLANLENAISLNQTLTKKYGETKKAMEQGIKPKVDKKDLDAVQTALDGLKNTKIDEGNLNKMIGLISKALSSSDKDAFVKLKAEFESLGYSVGEVSAAMALATAEQKAFTGAAGSITEVKSGWDTFWETVQNNEVFKEMTASFEYLKEVGLEVWNALSDSVGNVLNVVADLALTILDSLGLSINKTGKDGTEMGAGWVLVFGLVTVAVMALTTFLKGVAAIVLTISSAASLLGYALVATFELAVNGAKNFFDRIEALATFLKNPFDVETWKKAFADSANSIETRNAETQVKIKEDWDKTTAQIQKNGDAIEKLYAKDTSMKPPDDTAYNAKMEAIKAKQAENKKKLEEPMKVSIKFDEKDTIQMAINKVDNLYNKIEARGKTGLKIDADSANAAVKTIEAEIEALQKKIAVKVKTNTDVSDDVAKMQVLTSKFQVLKESLSKKIDLKVDGTAAQKEVEDLAISGATVGPSVAKGATQATGALKEVEKAAQETKTRLDFIGKDGTKMTLITPTTAKMKEAMKNVETYLKKEGKVSVAITPEVKEKDVAVEMDKVKETALRYVRDINGNVLLKPGIKLPEGELEAAKSEYASIIAELNTLKLNPDSEDAVQKIGVLEHKLVDLKEKIGEQNYINISVPGETAAKLSQLKEAIQTVSTSIFDLEFQAKRYGGVDFLPQQQKGKLAELKSQLAGLQKQVSDEMTVKVGTDVPKLNDTTNKIKASIDELSSESRRLGMEVQATLESAGVIEFSVEGQSAAKTQAMVSQIFGKVTEEAKTVKAEITPTVAPGAAAAAGEALAKDTQAAVTKDPVEMKVEVQKSTEAVDAAQKMQDAYTKAIDVIRARFMDLATTIGSTLTVRLDTSSAMNELDRLIAKITKSETKVVHVRTVQDNHDGGPVYGFNAGGPVYHRAGGGQLPGEGSFDTVPVMARPGEWWINNEAVASWTRSFGRGFMSAINTPWSAAGKAIKAALGGTSLKANVGGLVASFPSTTIQNFSTGGMVQTMDSMKNMGTVDLNVGGNSYPVIAPVDVINTLKTALTREKLRRPNP